MQISSKILFVACCLPACNLCIAQVSALSVYYDYDAAGNCVSRDIILSRSNTPEEKEKVNAFSEMLDELNVTYSPNPTQGNAVTIGNYIDINGLLQVECL